VDVVDRERTAPDVAEGAPSPRPGLPWFALVLALVALVCAAALPLAPVRMSVPVVSWPQQPTQPVSTMLELTSQRPLSFNARFSCAAVRDAAATSQGVVLATLVPELQVDPQDGLSVTATGGLLRIVDRGRLQFSEPVRAGDCSYVVHGATDPAQTGARLVVERDGAVLSQWQGRGTTTVLPDVDVLTTSLTRLASADDLRVRLTVDDQFNTTPGPVKKVLVVLLLVATAGSLLALRRDDRRRRAWARVRAGRRRSRVRVGWFAVLVDLVVVATLLLWTFIAPTTDDDGYYAAMAHNTSAEGFVGQYYQLLNQSFTPFSWYYRVLGWWEHVGDSPVVLRVPALVAALLTWLLLRRYLAQRGALPAAVDGRPAWRRGMLALAALAFLAWWLPYGMGVRPEAIAGVLALGSLYGVTAGLRRRRLLPVALAFGAAGLAVTCHPTGFVALGPLLVALPRLVPLVRAGASRALVVTRTALVLAPGALASAAAFADGSLHDFLRGQQIFLSVQEQNGWYDEYQRYMFLLSPIPMGSYARRAAVLLGLAALVWFAVVAAAARARRIHLPLPLLLAGQSLVAAYLLLWLTPSKWTHHFGALSGLGPAFLALFLAGLAPVVRRLTAGRRVGVVVPLLAFGTCALTFGLAMHGPNTWPYSWLPGLPHAWVPPFAFGVALDSPVVWAVLAALLVGAIALVRRRRGRRVAAEPSGERPAQTRTPAWLVAVPLLVAAFLGTSVGYLVGSFGLATVRTVDSYSPWASAVTDPLARGCGAAGALQVSDLSAARPLQPAPGVPAPPASSGFVTGAGWFAGDPPPSPVGQGVSGQVWGSLRRPGGEDGTGDVTTGWFSLPAAGAGDRLVVLAAGQLQQGDSLQVQYAAAGTAGQAPSVLSRETLADTVDQPLWRTFELDAERGRAAGATLVRLVAGDHSGGPGGWLAFTAPSVVPVVPVQRYLPADAPVAVAWQIALLFPCQRQPLVRWGITEPARYGILWRDDASGWGMNDNTWQVFRGGLYAPVRRSSSVTELAAGLTRDPQRNLQVFAFGVPYQVGAYDLSVERVTRPGWGDPPVG
jgi:hypothetical protein